jgi:WD40 repeat protein
MKHTALIPGLVLAMTLAGQSVWRVVAQETQISKAAEPKISTAKANSPATLAATTNVRPANGLASEAMVLLRKQCLSCHNQEKKKGGLLMVSRAALLQGGENGPVVVPGKAGDSLLAKVVLAESDPHMPPKKQLSEEQIALLRAWIDDGLKWDAAALAEVPAITIQPSQLRSLPASYQPVLAVRLSADGKRLAAGRGNQICIYDAGLTNHPILTRLEGHRDVIQSLAWSPDGKWLASGGFRRVMLWETQTFKPVMELTNLVGRVTALEFTPESDSLIAADEIPTKSGWIRVWTVGEAEPKLSWTAHADSILDLEISPDGKTLASAGVDKLVKFWELPSGKETGRLEGHTGHVWALAFKPDGSLLASGSADKDVKVWDFKTKDLKTTIGRHPASVTGLAWTHDGKSIISSCEDGAVRLCREAKESPDKTVGTADDMIYGVAVSPDAKTIYAGCHDGLVYVWDVDGKLKDKVGDPESPKKLAAQ